MLAGCLALTCTGKSAPAIPHAPVWGYQCVDTCSVVAGSVWTGSRGATLTSDMRQDACPGAGVPHVGKTGQVKAGSSSRVAGILPGRLMTSVHRMCLSGGHMYLLTPTGMHRAVRALQYQC